MKKMLILVAIVSLAACSQKKYGAFVVDGTVKNATGKKVYLQEIPFQGSNPVLLDSAELDKKGGFTLRAMGKEEGIYRFIIENGPAVFVVNDSKHISLEVDVKNFRTYKTKGSDATESLHTLFEDYSKKYAELMLVFQQMDTLMKSATPGNDSLKTVLMLQRDQYINNLNDVVRNFIKKSNSPAATFYAIEMASQGLQPEEIKQMVVTAANKYKEHNGLAKLKAQFTVPQKQPEQQAAPTYALTNKPAPNLTMNDVNGKPMTISSFKGKYVLVDFWASWCKPCRQENPNVVAAYNKFKTNNFTILGVSLDQDKQSWIDAIKADGLNWSHMSDLKYWESAAVPAYGIDGIPFNVLVDPNGIIVASNLRGADLETKLAELLK
jgi:peroxiredoxin